MARQLAAEPSGARALRRIEASNRLFELDLAELWRYRELLRVLISRDLKARYKQTFLGASWAVFRPVITMILFTIIFNRLAGIAPGGDIPYPLFVFSGLILWSYFSSALTIGSGSVLTNETLVSKAYFPRIYLPLSGAVAPIVDLGFALVVLCGLFVWYRDFPGWHVVFAPPFLLLTMATVLGLNLWLAPIAVRFRDILFALPFLAQAWMYVTPVIYPTTFIPEEYQWLLALNPMTAPVEGFRWSLVGGDAPGGRTFVSSLTISLVVLVTGLLFFRRAERRLADQL